MKWTPNGVIAQPPAQTQMHGHSNSKNSVIKRIFSQKPDKGFLTFVRTQLASTPSMHKM